jgi:hypothetical protein
MLPEKATVPDASEDLRYQALPDEKACIRLLRILTADEKDPLKCEMTIFAKDQAPPYCAISYTWGDATTNISIIVNEQRLEVRGNCEYALRQAALFDITQYFWIDAVCINQEDIVEKGHQVAGMGWVFEFAKLTLACVGRGEKITDLVYETMAKYSTVLDRLGKEVNFAPGALAPASRYRGFWKLYFGIRSRTLKELGNGTYALMISPYAYRAWCTQ